MHRSTRKPFLSLIAFGSLLIMGTGCPGTNNIVPDGNGNDNMDMMDNMDNMDGGEQPKAFSASLSGDQEVPPVQTNTSGSAALTVNADGTELTFTVDVQNGVGITQAHIHMAAAGVNGDVVAFLFVGPNAGVDMSGQLASGTLTGADLVGPLAGMPLSALVSAMESGNAYVNVHSVANGGGEVRGQISEDMGG